MVIQAFFYTKAQPRFLQDTETDKANLFFIFTEAFFRGITN